MTYEATQEKTRKHRAVLASEVADYATSALGGRIVYASNEHYGPAAQVISPFPPLHMFDGLESSRSRNADHSEAVIIKLGVSLQIVRIVLDFRYFINNNPRQITILARIDEEWVTIIPKTPVKAFAGNQKEFRLSQVVVTDELWIKAFPDGGINRIHVYGSPFGPSL